MRIRRFFITTATLAYWPSTAFGDLSLTLLHTSDVKGNVLPVHGGETACKLVPPLDDPSVTNCYGTQAQKCVVEYPACAEDATCETCAGGIAARVKFIETVKRNVDNVITVDTGNFFFGTQWMTTYKGKAINEYLRLAVFVDDSDNENEYMYDAMGVSSGELNQGVTGLVEVLKSGSLPRIVSNYEASNDSNVVSNCVTNDLVSCILPYRIVNRGGVDIGIVAMSPTDLGSKATIAGLQITDGGDPLVTVARIVDEVTSKGVKIIIVLSSLTPAENELIALRVDGVDVIVASNGSPHADSYKYRLTNSNSGNTVVIVGNKYKFGQSMGRSDLIFSDDGVLKSDGSGDSGEMRLDVEYVPFAATQIATETAFDAYSWQISKLESSGSLGTQVEVLGDVSGPAAGQSGNAFAYKYQCTDSSNSSTKRESCSEDPLSSDSCCVLRDGVASNVECCPAKMFWEMSGCRHGECPLGRLITNAVMSECSDCDVAIMNAGGIWGDLHGLPYNDKFQVSDVALRQALPYNDRISTFKLTESSLIQVLEHSVKHYHPTAGHGKFLQLAGLRMVWNPEEASLLRVDLCNQWHRVYDNCTGTWEQLSNNNNNRLVKVAANNFLRSGGDGYNILTKEGSLVFESNDFGDLLPSVMKSYLGKRGVGTPIEKTEIDSNCGGFTASASVAFQDSQSDCRIVRATGESPFQCPKSHGVTLRTSHPQFLIIEGGNDDTCSGFGICEPNNGYTCNCKNSLLEGFEFPQQYFIDINQVQESCGGVGDASTFFPGVALARGPACEQLRKYEPLGTMELSIVVFLCILCLSTGLLSLIFLTKKQSHPIVKASQPIYLKIVCVGVMIIGLFCLLSSLEPSAITCNAIPTTGAVGFSLVITPLVVKNQIIISIFFNTKMRIIQQSKVKKIVGIAAVALVELITGIVLAITVPFKPTVALLPTDNGEWSYTVICRAQNSQGLSNELLWTIPLVGFNMMLVLAAMFYAFQARTLPDVLSDSKYVGIGVYNIFVLGGTLLPMMFLISGNPGIQLLMRVVAVSVSVVPTLLVLIGSKFYLVWSSRDDVTLMDLMKNPSQSNTNQKVTNTATIGTGRGV